MEGKILNVSMSKSGTGLRKIGLVRAKSVTFYVERRKVGMYGENVPIRFDIVR